MATERIDDLMRVRRDVEHGGYGAQTALEWIAKHSTDTQSRDLAERVLEANEGDQ